MRSTIAASTLAVFFILFVSAAQAQVVTPQYIAPIVSASPTIDGKIDEKEWDTALRVVGSFPSSDTLDPRDIAFYVCTDGKALFIAVKSEAAPTAGLLARVKPDPNRDQIGVFYDDSIELWIDPHRGQTSGDQRYFQIAVNSNGAMYDVANDPANKQQKAQTGWRCAMTFKSQMIDKYWNAEFAIPFESIGATADDLKHEWGMHICRNWSQPGCQADWAPMQGGFESQQFMAGVKFSDASPIVRMLRIHNDDHEGVNVVAEMVNPTKQPLTATLNLTQQTSQNPPQPQTKKMTLAPGARDALSAVDGGIRTGSCATTISATSETGNETLFKRAFKWQVERPAKTWIDSASAAQAITLDIAYYPYHNKIKSRIDINGLSVRDAVKGVVLEVKPKAGGAPLAQGPYPALKENQSEIILDLPDLPDGTYIAEAKLQGDASMPKDPIAREFDRKHFEWEHNTLGISDKIIPPFTALAVDGKNVNAVLRTHKLNDAGLFDQVNAEGVDVLAAPMRYEVSVGGQAQEIKAVAPIALASAKPTEVSAVAKWQAGPIHAETKQTMEEDGMMKVALSLSQDGDAKVDKLDIVIPVRPEIGTLMHAVTDSLRFHFAGDVAKGDGVIWDSKKASRQSVFGNFVPYFWIGNETQGISWFAESDKDWLYDDAISQQELIRQNGQLVFKVHLVTKPGALARPRTITFGLQATPTKPMLTQPKNWRKWNIWFAAVKPELHNVSLWGSCYYWGTWGPCYEVYPRDRDFSIYDLYREQRELAKETPPKHVDQKKVDAWIDGYFAGNRGDPPAVRGTYAAHINWTINTLSMPGWDSCMPYTNARGAGGEEFMTFQDEWLFQAYTTRNWSKDLRLGASWYDISTVRSYQDFCLFYFKKMLDSKAIDGMYFDDCYLLASMDRVSGGAYIADDGSLRPAVDLFALREYMKRVTHLIYENRGVWTSMIHMTNTQVAPVNTWTAMNYDWEWRFSMEDWQDKCPRDLTRAETIGKQTGSVPFVLHGIQGEATPERKTFVERTRSAVCIVHEIKCSSDSPTDTKLRNLMYDFGYGDEDCKVYRYWDKPAAAKVSGVDAETLVLSKGGKAIIFVASYGDTGTCSVELSPDLLKLAPGGSFVDVESGQKVEASGPNAFRFNLPKHDFRMIRYE